MNPWLPIATRGCFDARVWTQARLIEEGCAALGPYLVVIKPHGEDEEQTPMWFATLDRLAAWVQDMRPRELFAHTAGPEAGEDCDELLNFLRGRRGSIQ